ncbi:hypothetical protein SUNI508_04906 [Seiridium unicorne]|uniref:Uncharacterized protein n=1 Tax=Seiridium unicorne TaxID=138068 RepID=A0ABR2V5N8_9PEZI
MRQWCLFGSLCPALSHARSATGKWTTRDSEYASAHEQRQVLLDVGLQKHTPPPPPHHAFSAELRLDLNLTARQVLVDILSSPPKPKTASEMLDLLSYICGLPGNVINRPILMRVWANHAVTREVMGANREELLHESQSVVVDVGGYKLIWAFTNAWDVAEEAIWKKGGSCLASKEFMR